EANIIPFCREQGIGILAYSPLAKGLLTGKYSTDTTFPPDDERARMGSFRGEQWRAALVRVERLKALAQAWDITTSQLAVAWVLANPAITVALVGAKTARQVEENAGAAAVQLSAERLRAIEEIVAGYRAPLSGE